MSVLISIKSKWCEKICHEIGKDKTGKPIYEKRIEVRKSAPKEVPFKAYIYCTRITDKKHCRDEFDVGMWKGNEHVIGEFVCDYIYEWKKKDRLELIGICPTVRASYMIFVDDLEKTCLTYDELDEYGKNKTLYGWHISDLKIYDKPKELSEFYAPCPIENKDCENCIRYGKPYDWDFDEKQGLIYCTRRLSRPPQSWQYIDEVKE